VNGAAILGRAVVARLSMSVALPLRAALTRGALVTLANWPVILIEFTIESLYKLALAVPVVGGALIVTLLAGGSVRVILAEGLRSGAAQVVSALSSAPVALASFLMAIVIVAAGGSLVMFLVKAGTLTVLITGERQAGDLERAPFRFEVFQHAYAYDIGLLLHGIRTFGRRTMILSLWLSAAYAVIGLAYLGVLVSAFRLTQRPELGWAWPLVVAVGTGASIITITIVNLVFDLMRIVVVGDDCGLRDAASRLGSFLIEDIRQVLGIFAVVGVLLILAAAGSLLVAAGLALVAWVPVVGLVVVPLQLAAWLVRGLLFQFMGLSAVAAYQSQYRRFSETDDVATRGRTSLARVAK
jgi:hypothetical protein